MKLPKISIIITTKNEEKDITKLLNSLVKLNYPKKLLEIIVVDDSTDNTPKIVRKYTGVKLIKGGNKGNSHAKNIGWRKAKGLIIFFLDADMIIHKDYIKETLKCYEDPEIGGTAHLERLANKNPNLIAKMLYFRKLVNEDSGYRPLFIKSARRYVLKKTGGFDSDYSAYDDWELGVRIEKAGYKCALSKGKVWHMEMDNLSDLYRQCRWMGKSISFEKYKLNTLKKIFYIILCSFVPIYIIFLFLDGLFRILGMIGLIIFLLIELQRSFKIFLRVNDLSSFLTIFFDYMTMSFTFIGIVVRIYYFGEKKIVTR